MMFASDDLHLDFELTDEQTEMNRLTDWLRDTRSSQANQVTAPTVTITEANGRSLREILDAGETLSTAEVRRLCLHLALELDRGFARGIAHGDLRPANVMQAEDGAEPPWVLLESSSAGTAGVAGHENADYAAPELSRAAQSNAPGAARKGADAAHADMYSLGVIALECLNGRRPSALDRLRFALRFRNRGGLSGIVAHLLNPRPERRFPSHAALVRALAVDEAAHVEQWKGTADAYLMVGEQVFNATEQDGRIGSGFHVPGAQRFLGASQGVFPLVAAGRRLVVIADEGPATLFTAEHPDQFLAASMRHHTVVIRRGDRIGCIDLLTERTTWCTPDPELSFLETFALGPSLSLVLSPDVFFLCAAGSTQGLLLRRVGNVLVSNAVDLPAPVREVTGNGVLCSNEQTVSVGRFGQHGGLTF